MPDYATSPNMSLLLPTVGVDPGPTWASDLNASLSIVDQHDHSSGSGVQITPNGLNITSDLSMGGNNLTVTRTVRLQSQSAALALATDLYCLYAVGVNLYYNDGSGNQIQMTTGGGVAGSPGSISSLSSPASAAYVSGSQTFVWQSAANTPANMDGGSVILRNISASSKGLTLNPPAAMAADYAVTFPAALPASQKFMTLDASGNIAATWAVDNSTLEVSSNVVRVKDLGIVTAKIGNEAVTRAKQEPVAQALSNSSGSFSTSSTATNGAAVSNLSRIQVATGRPIMLLLQPDGGGSAFIGPSGATNGVSPQGFIFILRDGAVIAAWDYSTTQVSGGLTHLMSSVGPLYMDVVAAGTYTYTVNAKVGTASTTMFVQNIKLVVWEL